ncbi:hypothetical protein UlMin_014566, partial [Ulmus minor]
SIKQILPLPSVLELMGDEIYDAMLNQTNVGDNNNKFYMIQVLESDDGSRFLFYNRWGRVGVKDQNKILGPYTSKESAIFEFEQKFHTKTKNYWVNRRTFVPHPKSYTWLEMDYGGTENESILVTLCEVDSISYLDEVASSPGSLDLARSVAIQEKYEEASAALGEMEKRVVMVESMMEATLQYQSGQLKAQPSPRSSCPDSLAQSNQDPAPEIPARKIGLLSRPFGLGWRDCNK